MTRKELGKNIAAARDAQALTKYRVAMDGNLEHATVRRIEKGSDNYTIDSLLAYLKAAGLTIEIKKAD